MKELWLATWEHKHEDGKWRPSSWHGERRFAENHFRFALDHPEAFRSPRLYFCGLAADEDSAAEAEHMRLVRQATLASAASFQAAWDDELDAQYDDLWDPKIL